MASSDEYLASLGFDASDVNKVVDQLTTVLAHAGNSFEQLEKYTNNAEKALAKFNQTSKSGSQSAGTKTADEGTAAWKKYIDAVNEASKATAKATTGGTGSSGGSGSGTVTPSPSSSGANSAASAANASSKALDRYNNSLSNTRYALYDVSRASAVVGVGLLSLGVATTATAIKYEALFSSVSRTATALNDVQLDGLRKQLVDLTTQIPVTFEAVTQIATLGNQLNIDPSNLAAFTKTVSEFSATTNVSVEAAATAFGRLGEILNTTDYKGLGDQIAYLGVKAVATESQIIAVSQQIAVSTAAAKFSTGQTLALATALASLGVAPEAARGVILRTFGSINAAITEGGTKLADFAAVSGLTSDQFKNKWKTDASGAFSDFVKGLGSDSATAASKLNAVGITATRDIQGISLLAQNYNVLSDAQKNAGDSSGYLDKSFTKVAETAQSKLTVAQNQVLRLFNDIGSSTTGPAVAAIDTFSKALSGLDKLLQNPVAAGGAALSAGILALGGVVALASAALFRIAASVAAVKSAGVAGAEGVGVYRQAFNLLIPSLNAATLAQIENNAAISAGAPARAAAAASTGAQVAGNEAVAASSVGAAASAGKLSGALGKAGLIGSVLALLPVLPTLFESLSNGIDQINGTSSSVSKLTDEINKLTTAAGSQSAQDAINKLLSLGNQKTTTKALSLDNGTASYSNQTLTPGKAYYNQQTTGNVSNAGTTISPAVAAGVSKQADAAGQNIKDYDSALASLVASGNLDAVKAGIAAFDSALKKQGLSTEKANSLLTQTNAALGATKGKSTAAALAAKQQAAATDDGTDAIQNYIDAAYGASNADAQLQTDLSSLGAAFVNNGAATASSGSEIQKVIADIYATTGGGTAAAAQLQGFFNTLTAGAYASKDQLSGLSAIIANLTGGQAIQGTTFDLGAFGTGMDNAAQSANNLGTNAAAAAPKVRTLVDYANDLSGVFSRSQDLQFGPQNGLDKINSDWLGIKDTITQANADIRTSIADTKAKILDLNATINSLKSDNSINQYFLSIAKNYGDTLRAGEITSDIADTNAKIKQATSDLSQAQKDGAKDVATAQEKTNKTLTGNSAAAIANRAEISGLVGDYSDYIAKLASSGLTQDQLKQKVAQLKQEFINQATQLGYTKSQVLTAATAFDDMTTAINSVPRDVTVSLSTKGNGATAVAEYTAALKALDGKTVSTNLKTNYDGSGAARANAAAAKAARLAVLQGQLSTASALQQVQLNKGVDNPSVIKSIQQYQTTIDALSKRINSNNYRSGGFTGNLGVGDVAGIVHGQEFVLNATGSKMLPMAQLNAMNQGRAPVLPITVSQASSNSSNSGPLELAPYDRQLLVDIRDRVGVTIAGNALQAANNTQNIDSTNRGSN